jgi:hypothetical protein
MSCNGSCGENVEFGVAFLPRGKLAGTGPSFRVQLTNDILVHASNYPLIQ